VEKGIARQSQDTALNAPVLKSPEATWIRAAIERRPARMRAGAEDHFELLPPVGSFRDTAESECARARARRLACGPGEGIAVTMSGQ